MEVIESWVQLPPQRRVIPSTTHVRPYARAGGALVEKDARAIARKQSTSL
ncbi:MAG TPA: hypothetical protein VF453_06425 [Burkholderiaceae bacterium]